MLNIGEGEEAFFDSVDYLSSEGPAVAKEGSVIGRVGYEIWMNEPQSIQERRKGFLRDMGFTEFVPKHEMTSINSSEIVGLERIAECSGAVLRSSSSPSRCTEGDLACHREENGDANIIVNEREYDKLNIPRERDSSSARECRCGESRASSAKDFQDLNLGTRKLKGWWKRLMKKRLMSDPKTPKVNRVKVRQNNKSCMEFSAVYVGQEIRGHEGYIWSMKFSPDGQYLASGGEDGVVRIWCVTAVDASSKSLTPEFSKQPKEDKYFSLRSKSNHASVVIPEKIFQIEEFPLHEFRGHTSDVLDLAWSSSNCLLSSSKDKTVRLWKVKHNECLNVFCHSNYVTCIQFNPIDENFFISGSIDGKVRIWGVAERRVVDWADVRDVVTATSYQPHGKGFIVGTVTGTCRFYEASGNHVQLSAQVHSQGKRKASRNKITSIQVSLQDPPRVLITSEDSRVRVYDGIDVVHKYRALRKSGSQMSASFTPTGKHIISVGEDSRIYMWNYDSSHLPSSKPRKSIRSCEHFPFEGVSVAVPWSSMATKEKSTVTARFHHFSGLDDHPDSISSSRGSERFSLGNWFSMDGPSRRSTTWPEEKLPLWGSPPLVELDHNKHKYAPMSETWGLVIVGASWDGTIRTFHNYGLPIKL